MAALCPLTFCNCYGAVVARHVLRAMERAQARQLRALLREPQLIPAFSADGSRRRRGHSVEACLHLEAEGLATLKRSRRGRILAVLFRDARGGNALDLTLKPGQRYSYLEPVRAGKAIWQHKGISTGPADFIRSVLDVTTDLEKELTHDDF